MTRFFVPFPPNEDFVGRQDILESLRQELSLKKSYAVAALFGLGGAGKTQIALAYVHEIYAQNPDLSVFWVYASNKERMRQSYATIMQQFEISRGEDNLSVLGLVKQWLEVEHRDPWLMVVDNVDDLDLFYGTSGLSRYLPTCAQGKLLLTTRNRQVAIRASKGRGFIEVPSMNEREARELLSAHLGCTEPDDTDLSTLALKLEYLPLVLVQAAAFIQENTISIKEYLGLLENDNNLVQLLHEDFETSGRDPDSLRAVAKTWMISFQQIRRQNELAGDLLALASIFNHQHIPESFLIAYLSSTRGQEEPLGRLKAIGLLKAFSVVSGGQDNSISMHRLIQLVMRRWLIQEQTVETYMRKAIMTIRSVSSSMPDDAFMQRRHTASHVRSVIHVFQSFYDDVRTQIQHKISRLSLFASVPQSAVGASCGGRGSLASAQEADFSSLDADVSRLVNAWNMLTLTSHIIFRSYISFLRKAGGSDREVNQILEFVEETWVLSKDNVRISMSSDPPRMLE